MLVTISEYYRLGQDANGNVMPVAKDRSGCTARTSAGAFAALAATTKFIRLATDTAIQMDVTGGATTAADELFPANGEYWLAVNGGETMTIALA